MTWVGGEGRLVGTSNEKYSRNGLTMAKLAPVNWFRERKRENNRENKTEKTLDCQDPCQYQYVNSACISFASCRKEMRTGQMRTCVD